MARALTNPNMNPNQPEFIDNRAGNTMDAALLAPRGRFDWTRHRLGTAMVAVSMTVSCARSHDAGDSVASMTRGIVRVTPSEQRVPADARWATVQVQLVTTATDTLFLSQCGSSEINVSLHAKKDGKWRPVENQFCSYVLSPPVVIVPGRPLSQTMSVSLDSTAAAVEYRFVAAIHSRWMTERPPEPSWALPVEQRTSNSFRIYRD
ncbi:MAG: hypothetical protein ABIV10_14290 [Gemmatimonadaceae bacterium]